MKRTRIDDVLNRRDAKLFVSSVNIVYNKDLLKERIFKGDDDDFLLITKDIGSTTKIVDVKKVDDSLINFMISE